MSTLRLATAANVRAFQILVDALSTSDSKSTEDLDGDALEDEIGRFRVWAGNLGALQKGHSSLDYRLRDSPNLLSSALKLLKELEHNLNETYAVVSGARLPYEAQTSTDEVEEDENDDGFFSEEDDSDGDEPRNELKMRFEEVVDIIDNLYKLSVRIRTPSIHSRSLKASSYAPTDPETGVDILGAYAELDKKHVQELLLQLRQPHASGNQEEQASLLERLSSSITLRRRHFKYWKRHRDKLGASAIPEDTPELILPALHQTPNPVHNNNLENYPITPEITTSRPTPSQKTGKTLLSGTEATHHHQSLDDIVDTKSVTSYAVTVKDLHGKGIELPPPPKAANGDKDFECPYCWIVCPARYGKGRAWKTHLLQDLQPYICTYQDCESSQQLFRSRREWAEHEATHRKLWRCPEHAAALYSSLSGLENHLRQDHNGSFPEDQIAVVTKIGETTATDTRTKCPICYAPANTAGLGDLQSHIANHLERFATFALPHGREDDSDGASSVASRGSSNSQSLPNSARTDTSNDEIVQEDTVKLEKPSELLPMNGPGQSLLSAERLQQLPDESQNRVSMITGQLNDLDDSEAEPSDDQQFDEDVLSSHKKHMDNQEAFRQHILTLPGALSVRFYRRYGSWSGLITFADDWVGKQALEVFDAQRFPNMDFKPKKDTTKWKFTRVGRPGKENVLNRQSTADTQATEDTETSAGSELYDQEVEGSDKQAIISADETPTLRSLYQSRRLLQRDQSFAPNDAYNQMISFCHYDLTRLRVDAIVNNAPSNLKATPSPGLLHYTVFQAGGSGLRKEARSKPRIKLGQVELTHGHDLPASWVIHAAAPTYTGTKGVGQFNVLSSCYRSALRIAAAYELKTIAFPCLGTGGCNFPPRVAARIALQEIREYLDSHPEHRPERIIFCVKAAIDEKAYTDFLPVFFPPTHGDLDRARTSDWSANRAALSAQVLEARSRLQKALKDISDTYVFVAQTMACAHDMRRLDSALNSIRNYLLGSKELKRSLGDLNLLCSVIGTACTTISEIAERTEEVGSAKEAQHFWDEVNTDMQAKHGLDLSTLFDYCWIFANSLNGVLTQDRKESDAMARARQVLENYGVKQKGQDVAGIRDYLDEVIHVRKSEGPIPKSREIIQVHQVPSVAQLYLLGSLEDKPTMAQPSASFNHTVCFLREDITRLAVDAMVNSTDVTFSGMGTLDRLVFKKGGPGLQWEVQAEQIGKCKEGDVKVTPGYLLPARHVIHVVPPGQFRKDTKTVLRGIYRDILHTAVQLKAASVAIPSIGTGMLNYPTRDCASIAMEEVKGFLESADPANGLPKIIFVVYSSNDEFVYKSLLPIYFPQPKSKVSDEPQREKQTPAQYQAALNVKNHMQREAGQEEREREIRERSSLYASLPDSVQQTAETRENSSMSYSTAKDVPALSGSSKPYELTEEDRLLLRLRDEEGIPWEDVVARFSTDFNKNYQKPALQMRLKRIKERIRKPRSMYMGEEDLLIEFESHVNDCNVCSDGLFERTHKLCEHGYPLAQSILQRMEMSRDAKVYSKPKDGLGRHKLVLPTDLLPSSMLLLSIVAKHAHVGNFDFPFDQVTGPHEATSGNEEDQKVNNEYTVTVQPGEVYDKSSLLFGEAGMNSHQRTGSDSSLRQPEKPTDSTAAKDTKVVASDAEQPAVIQAKVLGPHTSEDWTKSVLHIHGSSIEMYLAETYVGESPYATIDLANAVPSLARGVTSESPNTTSLFVERYEESKAKGTQRAEGDRMRETWHFLSARDSEAAVLFDALQRLVIRNRKTQGMMVPPATREGMDSALTEAPTTRVGMSGGTTDANVSSRNTPGNSILLPHFQDSRPRPRCWQHGCNGKLFSTFTNLLRHQRGKNLEFLGRQRLRAQILDYLADDLETRPGSYIGQNTENIASGTGMDTISATSLLHELAAQGNVHNTVNDDTWVISHRMDERPTEQLQKAKESGDTDSSTLADQIVSCLSRKGQGLSLEDLAGELQATSAAVTSAIRILASDGFITSGFDGQTWILTDLGEILTDLGEIRVEGERGAARYIGSFHPDRNSSGDLSERALSHLRSLPGMSKGISDLAITFVTPAAVLQPVLEQLRSDGLVENKDDESSWAAILAPNDPQLPILQRPYVTHGRAPISTQPDTAPTKQEQPAAKSPPTSKASSWRDGRGANERKHTRFARTLAEDVDEDVQAGTASNLRRARMAKERKHNKSSRASADDVDDELEYYDGQEEDYV